MQVTVLLYDTSLPPRSSPCPSPCPAQGLLCLQAACCYSLYMPPCLVSAGVHLPLVEVLQRDSDVEYREDLTDHTHSKPHPLANTNSKSRSLTTPT